MKTKDIKDYLHLYIGCKFKVDGVDGLFEICGVNQYEGVQNAIGVTTFPFERVKPILRPLSSMTEEEAIHIAIMMYGQPDSVKWRMEDKEKYFNVYRKHYSNSFTIDKASGEIDRYTKDGDQMELDTTLQHHFITIYMLSKGFDLFNLIPEGLAVEKQ